MRRATRVRLDDFAIGGISIHALREEGDDAVASRLFESQQFLSTPSARRATHLRRCAQDALKFSIHALREEGDQCNHDVQDWFRVFLSTPSARRATAAGKSCTLLPSFLSTPSARRTTRGSAGNIQRKRVISIHALREEGDGLRQRPEHLPLRISIHALREEGDPSQDVHQSLRPPISIHALREEGDILTLLQRFRPFISIHALREEGDAQLKKRQTVREKFLSTPSARRATAVPTFVNSKIEFLSTPSARRATRASRPAC